MIDPIQARLRALAERLQRVVHEKAVHSNALFSREYWDHNAGSDWPDVDDDSYQAFENCVHPDCVLVRDALCASPLEENDRKVDE